MEEVRIMDVISFLMGMEIGTGKVNLNGTDYVFVDENNDGNIIVTEVNPEEVSANE